MTQNSTKRLAAKGPKQQLGNKSITNSNFSKKPKKKKKKKCYSFSTATNIIKLVHYIVIIFIWNVKANRVKSCLDAFYWL